MAELFFNAYIRGEGGRRRPVFDISCKAQKANPFSRMSQNELAKELYGAGFFDADRAESSLIALELMDFEGKEKTMEAIKNTLQMKNQLIRAESEIEFLKNRLRLQEDNPMNKAGGRSPFGTAGSKNRKYETG